MFPCATAGTVETLTHFIEPCGPVDRTMADRERRVLSIQSTVVHGYAGGRSATFPLQLLGFVSVAIFGA